MSFVQVSFAIFLTIVFGVWLLVRGHYAVAGTWLLVASLYFYGFRQWWVLSIILSYCLVDWLTGVWLHRTQYRRLALGLGVGFNLLVLCFWKYTPLLLQSAATLFGWTSIHVEQIASGNWIVPMGISFYAFTGIAYMVDVYRRVIEPEYNPVRFALFTSFFPHLVAGPILRPAEFLTHLRPGLFPTKPLDPAEGAFLIARGFFKKLVLADSIAVAIDPFFAHVSDQSTAGVWATPYVYLYALQIYFDFSGYTDIARGLGLWFGFRWPENFNWPYLATSIQDFWRTLAHDAVAVPARLSLHPARRQSRRAVARLCRADDHHAARRPVARRELVVHAVGRSARSVPHHQPLVGNDGAARTARDAHRRAGRGVVLVPDCSDVQRGVPGVVLLPPDTSAGQSGMRPQMGGVRLG